MSMPRRRWLAGWGLTMLAACTDTVTAPQAESVLRTLEANSENAVEARERLWETMGLWEVLSKLRPATRVTVTQNGEKTEYSAIAFERLMVPVHGSGVSKCLGTRWSLYLWREGERPEGLALIGGRFDRPLGSADMCNDVSSINAQPMLARYPPRTPGDGWISSGGSGYISPGADVGDCRFLSADAAATLYRNSSITCRLTRHRVGFEAELHPWAALGTLARRRCGWRFARPT